MITSHTNPSTRRSLVIAFTDLRTLFIGRKPPKLLQERLLFPFGSVKGLHCFTIEGEKKLPSVEEAVQILQAQEEPSPEACLENCTVLKDKGNTALAAGRYREALDFYNNAFAAIHIECRERRRTIHADGFFCTDLRSGPDKGKRADHARMILRVRLVANIVLCFLKLEDWEEAYFWGRRSVILFRRSMTGDSSDDVTTDDVWLREIRSIRFPAQDQMGKIMYRTALAAKQLGRTTDTNTLLDAAYALLPYDENVLKEREIAAKGERMQ